MKSTIARGTAAALLACAVPAASQTTPAIAPAAVPGVTPIAAPSGGNAVLRTGTDIALRLSEELTTKGKKLRVGNRFRLEVSEPVVVQGVTVIPAGSPAVGEITDARNKGMWGKSGRLVARLLYVTVSGRQIRLAGGFNDKGTAGGIGAVAVSAVVFLPAGFFMTGTSAKVPMGTVVKGFIDEDVPLAFAADTAAPLPVAAPAAVPAAVPAAGTATQLR